MNEANHLLGSERRLNLCKQKKPNWRFKDRGRVEEWEFLGRNGKVTSMHSNKDWQAQPTKGKEPE